MYMYMYTRVLPSISIDDGVFRHCSLVAFAEVLDNFSFTEGFVGTAVWWHLQKFWNSSVESNAIQALQLGCNCRSFGLFQLNRTFRWP